MFVERRTRGVRIYTNYLFVNFFLRPAETNMRVCFFGLWTYKKFYSDANRDANDSEWHESQITINITLFECPY